MKIGFLNRPNRGLMAAAAIALVGAFALAGCSGQPLSTREKGTIGGGVIGAGTGAIIGAAVGAPGAGAAIGGALGAGTGYVIGNALQNQEGTTRQQQGQIASQQREIQSQRHQIQQLQSEQATE
jgi:osmotically inducible lipoprotein OsmB